jgi:hypothetical protein
VGTPDLSLATAGLRLRMTDPKQWRDFSRQVIQLRAG